MPLRASSPQYQLIRLHFKNQSQLQAWVNSGLDVWEVKDDTALVAVTKSQIPALTTQGVELDKVGQPVMASFPACYRTYHDMETFLQAREGQYPELLAVEDVGDTWEKQQGLASRELYAARLTSPEGPAKKPRLLLEAEHHAREIITPEIAMDFIDDLLENYGQDPTITWLLDNREVWVVPMANPDGHTRAVQAENWRKNVRPTASCQQGAPPNSFGVDLNRNYGFRWGDVGSSSNPCNQGYHGGAPFSEPETQAIRDLVQAKNFDLLVSLHSYGDSILFPWAYTHEPAPDAEALRALANRMAALNDYSVKQASDIGYKSSGSLTDWSYGELGIASFTFEVGGWADGRFWPTCEDREQLYQEMRPALIYAALASDQPLQRAGGPETRNITVQDNGSEIAVRAEISDAWTGGDAVQSAELFVETVGQRNSGIALSPTDGRYDSSTEWGTTNLDKADLLRYAGRRVPLLIVAEDATGKRGVPQAAWLDLRDYPVPASQAVSLWMRNASSEPTYEIKDGHVYRGSAENGRVLMTVEDGRVYRGNDTTGALLYKLEESQVRVGEAGPVIYSIQDNRIYRGTPGEGTVVYRVEYDHVMDGGRQLIASANVNLRLDQMDTACLLLPVLIDKRF